MQNNKTDFTLILDSAIVNLNGGEKIKHWALKRTIEFCEDNNMPYNNIYNLYSNDKERYNELKKISTNLSLSNSKGYLIVFSNNTELKGFKFYKYSPKNNLGTSIVFDDLSSSELRKYAATGLNNITTIVVEGPIINNILYTDIGYDSYYNYSLCYFLDSLLLTYYTKTVSTTDCSDTINFTLKREFFGGKFTAGKLYEGKNLICETLEDVVRFTKEESKIFKQNMNYPYGCQECRKKEYQVTAIPYGDYLLKPRTSGKFGSVAALYNLSGQEPPCFTDVLMHHGVTAENTWGCILMGDKVDRNTGILTRNYVNDYKTLIYNKIKNKCAYLEII